MLAHGQHLLKSTKQKQKKESGESGTGNEERRRWDDKNCQELKQSNLKPIVNSRRRRMQNTITRIYFWLPLLFLEYMLVALFFVISPTKTYLLRCIMVIIVDVPIERAELSFSLIKTFIKMEISIHQNNPSDFCWSAVFFFHYPKAIPHAIAMVRAADKKSPREAVEFILQLLKVVVSVKPLHFD